MSMLLAVPGVSGIVVGAKVQLALTESSGGGGAVGNAAPSFRSASVTGNSLTVTYDEPLDEGSTLRGNSFRVTQGREYERCERPVRLT